MSHPARASPCATCDTSCEETKETAGEMQASSAVSGKRPRYSMWSWRVHEPGPLWPLDQTMLKDSRRASNGDATAPGTHMEGNGTHASVYQNTAGAGAGKHSQGAVADAEAADTPGLYTIALGPV